MVPGKRWDHRNSTNVPLGIKLLRNIDVREGVVSRGKAAKFLLMSQMHQSDDYGRSV